jgi:hypothetical protein
MADEIGLVRLINGMVRGDTRQSAISSGERILVLVLDVLAGKTPLYRVWERVTTTDWDILVGAGRRARMTLLMTAWDGPWINWRGQSPRKCLVPALRRPTRPRD